MIHLPERVHKNAVLCFLFEYGRAVPGFVPYVMKMEKNGNTSLERCHEF